MFFFYFDVWNKLSLKNIWKFKVFRSHFGFNPFYKELLLGPDFFTSELQIYMAKMLLVCSERWCIGFLVFAHSVISNCVVHISCTYFLVLINNIVVCLCTFSLFSALCILIVGGFLKIFFGSTSLELVLSIGGAFLFSLFIIYDTQVWSWSLLKCYLASKVNQR